jgi:predicted esterase
MMGKRRAFLVGAASLAFGGLLAACGKSRTARSSFHGGVDFKELVPRKPDDTLPLVVAIHGRGGAPEHWVDGWTPFPGAVEIVLPRGFERHEEGYAWFPWSTDLRSEKLAAEVGAAEARLWEGVVAIAAGRRVVVAGYEEGAMLALVMAARHPETIVHAFAVAGACPESLLPRDKARAAPVTAYHGSADDVLSIQGARAAVAAWTRAGSEAQLREYAGVGHSPTDKMHADLWDDMRLSLRTQR